MRKTLSGVCRRIRRLNPGIVYLLAIPLFAMIFWTLPDGSFHDANVQYEPGLSADRAAVVQAVAGDYEAVVGDRQEDPYQTVGGMRRVSRAGVADVDATDGVVRVLIRGTVVQRLPEDDFAREEVPFDEYVVLGGMHDDPTISTSYGGKGVDVEVTSDASSGRLLHQGDVPTDVLVPHNELFLSYDTYSLLDTFRLASLGDPRQGTESWWRFLYLSAVTITTLGFGDITPVSTTARLLVGFQAVLGVVLIGLFLNRTAGRVRRGRAQASRPPDDRPTRS